MPDPTIPVHRKGRPSLLTFGKFVDFEDTVKLVDRHGNVYDQNWVQVVTGFWGFDEDGSAKLPRPWRYAPGTDQVLVKGDMVLIFFLDGNPHRPVVMGSVRSFSSSGDAEIPDTFDFSTAEAKSASQNTLKGRLRLVDLDAGDVAFEAAKGTPASPEVRWSLHAEGDGIADLQTTHYAQIRKVVPIVPVEAALRAETFASDLATSLGEVSAALVALGTPPASLINLTAMIAALTASLTAGAPYISTTLKVE